MNSDVTTSLWWNKLLGAPQDQASFQTMSNPPEVLRELRLSTPEKTRHWTTTFRQNGSSLFKLYTLQLRREWWMKATCNNEGDISPVFRYNIALQFCFLIICCITVRLSLVCIFRTSKLQPTKTLPRQKINASLKKKKNYVVRCQRARNIFSQRYGHELFGQELFRNHAEAVICSGRSEKDFWKMNQIAKKWWENSCNASKFCTSLGWFIAILTQKTSCVYPVVQVRKMCHHGLMNLIYHRTSTNSS